MMIFPNSPIVVDFVSPLAGGFTTSEKYEVVSWNEEIPKIWFKKKTCSKPPTNLLVLQRNMARKRSDSIQMIYPMISPIRWKKNHVPKQQPDMEV